MPCGPLQSMQIVALASASPFLSMFFFALGTVPLMLGFCSIIAGIGKRFTKQVLKCGAILVVVMGLSMMSQGTALSGMNSRLNTLFSAKGETAVGTSDSGTRVEKDDIQYVSSTLESGHYPDITVKAGTPVEWTIHAEKSSINGCNYKILLPAFDTEYVFEEADDSAESVTSIKKDGYLAIPIADLSQTASFYKADLD